MTMTKDSPIRAEYLGDGAQLSFPIPFRFLEASHVAVAVGGVPRSGGYAVLGAGDAEGGTLVFDAAPTSGVAVAVSLVVPIEQPVSLRQQGPFRPETLESALDRATMILRRLDAALGDALRFAGGLLDAQGGRIVNVGPATQATDAANLAVVQGAVSAALAGGGRVTPGVWSFLGDGTTLSFALAGATLAAPEAYVVTVGGVEQEPTTDYEIDLALGRIVFASVPPPAGAKVYVRCWTYAAPQTAPAVYAEADLPAASAALVGRLAVVQPATGPAELRVCLRGEDGLYGWSVVATGGFAA